MSPARAKRRPAAGGESPQTEQVWRALADPTRRAILDLLREGPLTAGDLAGQFAMTRFGVRKHLQVLREAGLVLVEERGRERWQRLNPLPIRELYLRWMRPFEEAASDHLLDIRERAESRATRGNP